jgi:hypothetical protein
MDQAAAPSIAPTPATVRSAPDPADEVLERLTWRPLPSQMNDYARREVELCVMSIRKGAATAQSHTLYSQRTWDAAVAFLGGSLPNPDPKALVALEEMRMRAAAAASRGAGFFKRGGFEDRRGNR